MESISKFGEEGKKKDLYNEEFYKVGFNAAAVPS